jgi:acetyl esterase/lipase
MTIRDRIDPELRDAYDAMPDASWDIARVEALRRTSRLNFERWRAEAAPIAGVETADVQIPGPPGSPEVRVRLHNPAGEVKGAMLWLHGGGYIVGQPEQDDLVLGRWAAALGCLIAAPAYRLAPEHPYPAGHDDAFAAWLWLAAEAERRGVPLSRTVVGGMSAGGGHAAALALRIRDQVAPAPGLQLLLCPMLDDRGATASIDAITDARVWNGAKNALGWRALLGGLSGDPPPHAAPARARDLGGLPSAYVMVSDLDPLLDEDVDYAQRLMRAGVRTELHVYPRAFHGFQVIAPEAAVSRQANADTRAALARALMR